MKRRLSKIILSSKSIKYEHLSSKNLSNNKDNKKESDNSYSIKLLAFFKRQKNNTITPINPLDELTEEIVKNLKLTQTNDPKLEYFNANSLIEKASNNYKNGKIIKLVELIFHILKKCQKSDNEILILKLYFLKMDKLISLLSPLKIDISDMLGKLVCQIKTEKKNKDTILFRAGDIGEKLYILMKGNISVLIKKEINIECTKLDFLKYLILLHLYQEDNLLYEIIMKNNSIVNIEEKGFMTLLLIFKFYYFLKENNRLKRNYNSIFDFISGEKKINNFINKKYNYSPMLSLEILNYERSTIEQLYYFYKRKIKEINKSIKYSVTGKALLATFIKRQIKPTINNKILTQEELLSFLKLYDEKKKKFKSYEEYFQKIAGIYEISPSKISNCNVEKYLQRLHPEKILILIQEDTKNHSEFGSILEQNIKLKTNIYYEINNLSDGSIFGEIALSDPTSKRSATVITKEDCYFGIIIKKVYDISLRVTQEKMRLKNISFFTRGPIFNGLSNNIFLNKFFYLFKRNSYRKGDILFKKGEERTKIIFVIKGELELSGNMTLSEITNTINSLGGILDNRYLNYLFNNYSDLSDYYYNFKQNIKFCVLKDKEILGLEDLTLDGINIFDCTCVSTDKTEVYELDYTKFENAKKYIKIRNNIIDFVNLKRHLFIKILLDQRNALIKKEINKTKDENNKENFDSLINNTIHFLPTTKDVKFSEKKIMFSNDQKKLINKFDLFKNKKFKSRQKSEKNKFTIYTLSTKDIELEKNNLSKNQIKNSETMDIISKDNSPESIIKNKTQKRLKLKQSFFNKNLTNTIYDNFNSSIFSNSHKMLTTQTNFYNTFKPFIQRISHSRTRKKLIPYFSSSYTKKVKGQMTPRVIKEYQKKFPEMRYNINLNYFYLERQDIFNSLLNNEDEENSKYISKIYSSRSNNDKDFISFSSYNSKEKNNKSNRNTNNRINIISKENQTAYNFFKPKKYSKINNPGIIDFLCLDNWEEKEQFQKKFFSKKNFY